MSGLQLPGSVGEPPQLNKAPVQLRRKTRKKEIIYKRYLFAKSKYEHGYSYDEIAEMLDMKRWDIWYYLNRYKVPYKRKFYTTYQNIQRLRQQGCSYEEVAEIMNITFDQVEYYLLKYRPVKNETN